MQIENVGILGAGTMGKQLALLCASSGVEVSLWNHRHNSTFEKELRRLALLESRLGNINKDNADRVLAQIQDIDDMSALASCDLLIEAVTENYQIKSEVLTKLAAIVDLSKIVSSITSTLSITGLASLIPNPSRFIGTHFFNPPMSMKLVEVVRGEHTSDEVVDSVLQFIGKLEKQPVVMLEAPGFVVNRLLFPMINEAIFLLAEGVSDARTIDSCMKLGANHPMGPLELADLIGLDVCLSILETLVDEIGDGKYRPAPLLRKYVRANKLGRKTGQGFYPYRKRD